MANGRLGHLVGRLPARRRHRPVHRPAGRRRGRRRSSRRPGTAIRPGRSRSRAAGFTLGGGRDYRYVEERIYEHERLYALGDFRSSAAAAEPDHAGGRGRAAGASGSRTSRPCSSASTGTVTAGSTRPSGRRRDRPRGRRSLRRAPERPAPRQSPPAVPAGRRPVVPAGGHTARRPGAPLPPPGGPRLRRVRGRGLCARLAAAGQTFG